MAQQVTLEDIKRALPQKKRYVTEEAVDIINRSLTEPEFQGESLLKSAATYETLFNSSRTTIPEYLNAIRFCAFLTSNENATFTEAYSRVFCERDFVKQRIDLDSTDPKYCELTSAASRYRRSKLVVDILTASQVPLDLIFTGARYKAIGILADIMETGRYDRDRINAAKELLAATKGAENVKIELDIGIKEDSAVKQLNDQLAQMAARQKEMLESGASTLQEFGSMQVKENVFEGEYSHE